MKTLVAGIGNIFLGDDAFGVEVVRRIDASAMLQSVHVEDFGIRGIHLAHELLAGYDAVVLVDCLPGEAGDEPGTVSVFEVEGLGDGGAGLDENLLADAHSFPPDVALEMVRRLGGRLGSRVYVVGCVPESVTERLGLSDVVEAAVERGVAEVTALVHQLHATTAQERTLR